MELDQAMSNYICYVLVLLAFLYIKMWKFRTGTANSFFIFLVSLDTRQFQFSFLLHKPKSDDNA